MKNYILVILLGLMITACSSPSERAETVEDYGEIIWRERPTDNGELEIFICRDEHYHVWIIEIDAEAHLMSANKISGYKLINETN